MRRDQLPIAEPCHADWNAMSGDEQRRFCGSCDKHVHDLSAMTAPQAEELLAREAEPCVRYAVNASGRVQHRASGLSALIAMATALVTPAAAMASPALVEMGEVVAPQAQHLPEEPPQTCPLPPYRPTVKPVFHERLPIIMGRVAVRPGPEPVRVSPTVPHAELPKPPPGELVIPEVQAEIDAQQAQKWRR